MMSLARFQRIATVVLLLVAIASGVALGAPNGPVVLVRDGQPSTTIVDADQPHLGPERRVIEQPPDAEPIFRKGKWVKPKRQLVLARVDYFARDLQRRIEQATGAKLPVAPASKAPKEGALILVGTSELSKKYGFDGSKLEPEEVRIETFDRGLAIYGELEPGENAGAVMVSR